MIIIIMILCVTVAQSESFECGVFHARVFHNCMLISHFITFRRHLKACVAINFMSDSFQEHL